MKLDVARNTAVKILHDIYEKKAYSNVALNKGFSGATNLTVLDRSFVTELVYGTVKHTITFDWLIAQYSKIKFHKISKWILIILRMGLYQIFFMDKVPHSAACNESVKLAEHYGHQGSKGFVNGVLRSILRDTNGDLQLVKFPCAARRYGYPEWMVDLLEADYGEECTLEILKAYEEPAVFSIRANRLNCTKKQLLTRLLENGITARSSEVTQDGVLLDHASDVTKVPGFAEGWFYVQGESSMLVGQLANPKPGDQVLDLCSAPGGKATHMAEKMENRGVVIAGDIYPAKLEKIRESAERLGITIIKTVLQDASSFVPEYEQQFDCVVADVPCSGLGILRKKPEIRLQRTEKEILELLPLQQKILECGARYVKPGGTLIYSTCSILKKENEAQVAEFLRKNKDFSLCREESPMTILPQTNNTDGFFIAKMRRSIETHG